MAKRIMWIENPETESDAVPIDPAYFEIPYRDGVMLAGLCQEHNLSAERVKQRVAETSARETIEELINSDNPSRIVFMWDVGTASVTMWSHTASPVVLSVLENLDD